jgi:single-strand DNA-binding protein
MDRKGLAAMSQDNQITLRGYLTAEPKLHQKTPTAVPVTEIRVGSTPRRLNRETGEWQEVATSYYTIKCWRRLAINTASSLHKGDMVVVRGKFYMNNWIDNQQRSRATLEIEADSIGHDLAYGWSHYLRGSRPQGGRAADAGETARQEFGSSDPGNGDDPYSVDGDPGGQADTAHLGFGADPLTAVPFTSTNSITESDQVGHLGSGSDPAESGLTGDYSLQATESVPF